MYLQLYKTKLVYVFFPNKSFFKSEQRILYLPKLVLNQSDIFVFQNELYQLSIRYLNLCNFIKKSIIYILTKLYDKFNTRMVITVFFEVRYILIIYLQ